MAGQRFLNAIRRRPGLPGHVIAEIKRTTGQGEDLLGAQLISTLVNTYRQNGASALSVVTGKWFGGTRDMIGQTRAYAKGMPVLRKDFLCSPRAIDETADLGADAALITAKLVPQARLAGLIEYTLARGVTPFVEFASALELQAIPDGLPIILAVNNADIETREVYGAGLKRSHALYDLARKKRPGAVVSASQITHAAEASDLLDQGFDALLIGTALMRRPALLSEIIDVQLTRIGGILT